MIVLATCGAAMPTWAISPSQQKEVIAKINAAASGMKSMSCSFTQTKHLSLLSDKMESRGMMYYSQPGKLRWEYTSPYDYLFVFNGAKVYMGNKSKKDVIDTSTNKVFKEIARIMMNTVTGRALSGADDFTVSVAEAPAAWLVTLVPKKKDMKQMFSRIEMSFGKSNSIISELTLIEKNGDKTVIKFADIKTNTALNENLFAIP